jgi:membrane protein YqaA with SNARE-associated domain
MKRKILTALTVFAILTLVYYFFHAQIFFFIQSNPTTAKIYSEIAGKTLLGLFYISILSALFFITLPAEIPFVYYLFLGNNPIVVAIIVLAGNAIGLAIDYLIGFVIGQEFVKRFLKEKYNKWHERVMKWGGVLVVIGNVIPSPIEVITVVFGGLRYPFLKLLKYSSLGRILKFVILTIIYYLFASSIIPYVSAYFP